MSSPTQRSLALLRERGYVAQVVEQTIRGAGIVVFKRDLFGIGDIIAVRDGETLLVQTTSGSNVAARIAKIAECEHVGAIRKAGWRLVVHGWRKLKGRWTVREVDVS